MTEHEIIRAGSEHLHNAMVCWDSGDHESYSHHMQLCLDLLIEELIGSPPASGPAPNKVFNPEQVLEEIAIAIKHRTISHTERWKIVYYHERLTCVPAYADVPEQIVLHEFTERMVHRGFTTYYWHQLKMNVLKMHKEFKP